MWRIKKKASPLFFLFPTRKNISLRIYNSPSALINCEVWFFFRKNFLITYNFHHTLRIRGFDIFSNKFSINRLLTFCQPREARLLITSFRSFCNRERNAVSENEILINSKQNEENKWVQLFSFINTVGYHNCDKNMYIHIYYIKNFDFKKRAVNFSNKLLRSDEIRLKNIVYGIALA